MPVCLRLLPDLNPGSSAPETSTLTTRLPSHRNVQSSNHITVARMVRVLMAGVRSFLFPHGLRRLLGISWYDRVRNDEVLQRTGLTSLSHLLSSRRISVFGHVARLGDVTPANMALQLHINVSLKRPPDRTWRRPPGRPRNKWVDQLRNDSTRPIGDLWRRGVDRGHGGATTRRPSSAT